MKTTQTKIFSRNFVWFTVFALLVISAISILFKFHKASAPSPLTNTTVKTDWKIYKSPVEKFSVSYPSNWRIVNHPIDTSDTTIKEAVSIEGPDNFVLSYDIYKLNDNSQFNCNNCSFREAQLIPNSSYGKPLYVVINNQEANNQPVQSIGVSEYTDREKQPYQGWTYYSAKNNKGYVVRWSGKYMTSSAPDADTVSQPYTDFTAKPESKTAQSILLTLHYFDP